MLIAHLSDPHLREKGQLYQGLVDSNAMFDLAVKTLQRLSPEPDLVIIGGDLVDGGSPGEYVTVRQALSGIRQPIYAVPGNHDDREAFRHCFRDFGFVAGDGPLHFETDAKWPVRFIGLDITVPGEHHGEMDGAACRWLETRLAEFPEKPTAILMHQPPINSGIPFIDAYKCNHGERLAEIVMRYPNVERVMCGHIHRFMQMRFGGTMLVTAPSTTTAIALRLAEDAEPASYIEPPAFLLHHWTPQTGLVTH
ncbi:MAG: phosphodiesterase, partial [Rhodoferax sp.]|nr:phosphodiesterase [Pseudorhodobacter sp.]